MKPSCLVTLGLILFAASCGPTPEEQRAMDMQKCGGFGFAPGPDAFAHCMMGVSQQREAQAAADQRAATAQAAANQRNQDMIKAAQDRADQDAWDKRTGQGAYSSLSSPSSSSPSSSSPFGASPVDQIRNQILQDQQKIESGE